MNAEADPAQKAQPANPRLGDTWTCATSHHRAQAALRLIDNNQIREFEAMEHIYGLLTDAGPEFCERFKLDQVPF